MSIETTDVREAIAMSPEPATEFASLPRRERRDVFFALPESVREAVATGMDRSQLETFVDPLDPDEVTDVLGYVDEETREAVLTGL
ncbi:magnesium transporter MgtE N-terminal domain-containing protein, partial [Halorubrum sp. AJ67]